MESNDNNVYDGPIIPLNMALSGLLIGGTLLRGGTFLMLGESEQGSKLPMLTRPSSSMVPYLCGTLNGRKEGSAMGGSGWNKHGTNDVVTDKRKENPSG